MDTITHTLFGLAIYGAVSKEGMSKQEKRALLACSLAGSQIPDIDVISSLWDTEGRYQMWHRGITHSIFLAPLWAGLLAMLARTVFRVKGWFWFWLTLIAVAIHNTSDIFNSWGTGYLEPFSTMRVTFGTIPIVDLVFWLFILSGYITVKYGPGLWPSHQVFRVVWLLIALHVGMQSAQGVWLYQQTADKYDQVTLVADFVPTQFMVVGKKGETVELLKGSVYGGLTLTERLKSDETADKERLFRNNPKARTLTEWSPFVVWEESPERIAVYDPRFYRNGFSFLTEEYRKEIQ